MKFIFATTDPHKMPATIHSRCQRYDFKRVPLRLIAERLQHISASEGMQISEQALYLIAREGEGSVRDAQSLLDQVIAFNAEQLSDDDVIAALGFADRRLLFAVADAIVGRQPGAALERVDETPSLRLRPAPLLPRPARTPAQPGGVQGHARGTRPLADLPEEERSQLARQADAVPGDEIERAFRVMLAADEEIARTPYPKLVLEMALLKLATMPPLLPVEEVLEQSRRPRSRGRHGRRHTIGVAGGRAGWRRSAGAKHAAAGRSAPKTSPPSTALRGSEPAGRSVVGGISGFRAQGEGDACPVSATLRADAIQRLARWSWPCPPATTTTTWRSAII